MVMSDFARNVTLLMNGFTLLIHLISGVVFSRIKLYSIIIVMIHGQPLMSPTRPMEPLESQVVIHGQL